jgi:hypothetical protein
MKPVSVYQQVMGADFVRLPEALKHFHALQGNHVLGGWVEVRAPSSFAARLVARCLGAPLQAQAGPLRFELAAGESSELWTRHFPGRTMTSRLTVCAGRLVEHLGAARLSFDLEGRRDGLQMQLVGLHVLGIPCPRWLRPAVVAEETAASGRLLFRVEVSLPGVGVVASYRGHLDVPGEALASCT